MVNQVWPEYITEEQRTRLLRCGESAIVVFTTGGPGVERWINKCLASVAGQSVLPALHVVTLAERVARERARTLVGALSLDHVMILDPTEHTYDAALRLCRLLPPSTIIVTVDGDDWLAHSAVLALVRKCYEDPDCWMTYGNMRASNPDGKLGGWHCSEYPPDVVEAGSYRQDRWRASHLRTIRAGLVQQVPWEYLTRDGRMVHHAQDRLYILPCLELARERAKYVPIPLLVYNNENPTSPYHTLGPAREQELDDLQWILSLPSLPRLEERPW